jgi:hypothetical protein
MTRLPLALACALWLCACSRTGLGIHSTARGGSGGDVSVTGSAATGGAGSGGAALATTAGATAAAATGGSSSRSPTDARPDGPADTVREAAADDGCLIATRTDTCCGEPFVINRHEMDYDPCVQPYFQPTYLPECVARRPPECAWVDCAFTPPLTRVVGRGAEGRCQYLSECDTADDCLRASDLRQCCGCPDYVPRALVEADGCLQDPATVVEWQRCPDTTCRTSSCVPHSCPAMPPALCSSNAVQAAAGLRACTWQVPWTMQCAGRPRPLHPDRPPEWPAIPGSASPAG